AARRRAHRDEPAAQPDGLFVFAPGALRPADPDRPHPAHERLPAARDGPPRPDGLERPVLPHPLRPAIARPPSECSRTAYSPACAPPARCTSATITARSGTG